LITGAQIRQARKLLGWEPSKLARRAKVHSLIIERAESVAGEPPITAYQAAFIREALLNAGVEFTNGDEPARSLPQSGGRGSPLADSPLAGRRGPLARFASRGCGLFGLAEAEPYPTRLHICAGA
jgi:hypothetical protein